MRLRDRACARGRKLQRADSAYVVLGRRLYLYGDALVRDGAGNLFGVADYGGAHGQGSVYELQNGSKSYTFVKLYDFCAAAGCSDGALPFGLSMDAAGNLYATTASGGPNSDGEVFMLSPVR